MKKITPFLIKVKYSISTLVFLSLTSCSYFPSSLPKQDKSVGGEKDGEPQCSFRQLDELKTRNNQVKVEAQSRYGNPTSYEVYGVDYFPQKNLPYHFEQTGLASWYGSKFEDQKTSSGEVFDPCATTAAHRTAPIPSYFEVENLQNGKKIIVRVNDRGPFIDTDKRIIDLSFGAAYHLGFVNSGTASVKIKPLAVAKYVGDFEHSQSVLQLGAYSHLKTAHQQRNELKLKLKSLEKIADFELVLGGGIEVDDGFNDDFTRLYLRTLEPLADRQWLQLRKGLNRLDIDHHELSI